MDDNGQEKRRTLYYIINVFIYGLYALAFAVIQKKESPVCGAEIPLDRRPASHDRINVFPSLSD
jgi:hypothetical protein